VTEPSTEKRCTKCGEVNLTGNFRQCLSCRAAGAARRRAIRARDPEKAKKYFRGWQRRARARDPEKVKEQDKKKYINNMERERARSRKKGRAEREANPEKSRTRVREYRIKKEPSVFDAADWTCSVCKRELDKAHFGRSFREKPDVCSGVIAETKIPDNAPVYSGKLRAACCFGCFRKALSKGTGRPKRKTAP
jgi:hypothetical protein